MFALLCCTAASAQQSATAPPCAYGSNKLICTVPNVFGPNGLGHPGPLVDVGASIFHDVHFNADFQTSFTALNSAIGTQLSLLQLASPASGFTFTFNRSIGIVQQSNESFGPILSERAETIGRHKVYVGVTYQFIPFNSLNGVSLRHIPVVFQHVDTPGTAAAIPTTHTYPSCVNGVSANPNLCNPVSVALGANNQPTYANDGFPYYERDVISTQNSVDLKMHQFTFFATFGLTSRIDVSVAIPVSNVRIGVNSVATIVPNGEAGSANPLVHLFDCTKANCLSPAPGLAANTSLQASFSNAQSATGIGDVTFRVKGTVFRRERVAVALGADFRTPTGDAENFLGSGAFGFKPFVAASYRARVSPHANIGFQWSGNSVLAGDAATGTSTRLPRQFLYSGGVDAAVTRKLTVAADLIGTRVFSTATLTPVTFTEQANPFTGVQATNPDTFQVKQSYNTDDGSIGFKYNPFGHLLVTANLLFKLNEGGLRSNVSPLLGISYTF
jgi:hypothetical protein